MHTANYTNTFIEIAEGCPAKAGVITQSRNYWLIIPTNVQNKNARRSKKV